MTREEYAGVRDVFLAALRELENVQEVFLEAAWLQNKQAEADHEVAAALEDYGSWLKAGEYYNVVDAMLSLERLVGRAHLRAT